MIDEKRILVFTACYNEKENIEKLILKIRSYLPNSSILIIDDNSPDNTSQIVKKLQENDSNLSLIVREKKLGLDTAHKLAYQKAIEKNYKYLITMDADLSHDPKELINFKKNLEHYPFVIGSRYISGGKCLMKGSRLIMSKLGNSIIKFFSRINCNEFTTSYRGFNIHDLKNFHLKQVNQTGYSFFMGTLFAIDRMKVKIKEIPIIFNDRQEGVSKIPKLEIFRTLTNLAILTLRKFILNKY